MLVVKHLSSKGQILLQTVFPGFQVSAWTLPDQIRFNALVPMDICNILETPQSI